MAVQPIRLFGRGAQVGGDLEYNIQIRDIEIEGFKDHEGFKVDGLCLL